MVNRQQEAKDGLVWLEKYIEQLESERDYLDARLADFERLATEFVNFDMPDCVCRARFNKLMEEK